MNSKYCLLSLGCPKNQVDAECMGAILEQHGFGGVSDPAQAEVLIVNTCGFIEQAKKEAIDAILEMASYKQVRPTVKLIVTGCLAQRYAEDILTDLPEVDAVLGTAQYGEIYEVLQKLHERDRVVDLPKQRGSIAHLDTKRSFEGHEGYAYIKIAEGCSHACAYCAIPSIRGKQTSRSVASITKEVQQALNAGVSEIILIAQDTTSYGVDLSPQTNILALLQNLVAIEKLEKIRLMYIYADGLTAELLEFWQNEPKLLKYFDIPIQHASNKILELMQRRDTKESLTKVFKTIRTSMPEAVLRTTVMVGFPGESEDDYEELKDFLAEIKFDRLGCFVFSPEEGTRAFTMPNQVSYKISEERFWQIMNQQKAIDKAFNQKRIGEIHEVILENVSADGLGYDARTFGEAPEVDPPVKVYVDDSTLSLGDKCRIKIVDLEDDQLIAVNE